MNEKNLLEKYVPIHVKRKKSIKWFIFICSLRKPERKKVVQQKKITLKNQKVHVHDGGRQ